MQPRLAKQQGQHVLKVLFLLLKTSAAGGRGGLDGSWLAAPLRIHDDSCQEPEIVAAVPNFAHLPRGDGGPLLVLPKSVQFCGGEGNIPALIFFSFHELFIFDLSPTYLPR